MKKNNNRKCGALAWRKRSGMAKRQSRTTSQHQAKAAATSGSSSINISINDAGVKQWQHKQWHQQPSTANSVKHNINNGVYQQA